MFIEIHCGVRPTGKLLTIRIVCIFQQKKITQSRNVIRFLRFTYFVLFIIDGNFSVSPYYQYSGSKTKCLTTFISFSLIIIYSKDEIKRDLKNMVDVGADVYNSNHDSWQCYEASIHSLSLC